MMMVIVGNEHVKISEKHPFMILIFKEFEYSNNIGFFKETIVSSDGLVKSGSVVAASPGTIPLTKSSYKKIKGYIKTRLSNRL
jgi:hypothetical protein